MLGAAALLYAVLAGVGLVLTTIFGESQIVGFDDWASEWFVQRRTPTLDAVTDVGSSLADTLTAIVVTAVLVAVLRLWLGRWRESVAVLAAIIGELLVFLLVTNSVGRRRPPVLQLDEAPPTSSFPSGHTAAAVALYGCLAVVVLRQMSHRGLAVGIAVLCWTVAVVVGLSRIYRGMHYPSDVVFGFLGGGTWLVVVVRSLMPPATYGAYARLAGRRRPVSTARR
jgi:undecaprenyl-diphosphatase